MFWENFISLCSKLNKSPNAVANELGFSTGVVTTWKRGSQPREKTLQIIANYFGVSVDELLSDKSKDEMQDAMEIREALRSRDELRILFKAAKNAPASALMEAASIIMRYKEEAEGK